MSARQNQKNTLSRSSRWGLLKDGSWFAALIVLSTYVLNVVEERGQLRSDVSHLTDTLAQTRKELDAARLDNTQLTAELRTAQITIASKEVRLVELDKQLSTATQDAQASKSEAQIYKDLTASDKRCAPYRQDVEHLKTKLNISALDVFSPTDGERKEIQRALERGQDSLDACMGLKR